MSRMREGAKLALRRSLLRLDLDIGRTPFVRQVVQAAESRGIDTLLDIGANVGQYATLVRAAGFTGAIVSLEPLPSAYAELERRLGKDRAWTGMQVAAGATPGRVVLHEAANSYSSSVLTAAQAQLAADPDSRGVVDHEVDVTTVAEVCATRRLPVERLLLKIDTQGFESAVLDGCGDLLDRVPMVQLELSHVEMYAGQAGAAELTERLAGHGLAPWTWDAGVASSEGRLLQSDCLFVRG